MDRRHPPAISGRIPLAVIVVDEGPYPTAGRARLFGPAARHGPRRWGLRTVTTSGVVGT